MATNLETIDQLGFFTMDLEVNPLFATMQEIREEVTKKYVNLDDLTPGNYISITFGEHYKREGIFALKGSRVNARGTHYFFKELMPRNVGGKKVLESRGFAEFSSYIEVKVEIITKGYKPNYQLPDKDAVYLKLVKQLKQVPFGERIQTYNDFCKAYPQYEVGWSKLLNDLWYKCILAATTPDEVEAEIMDKKHKHGRSYNSSVKAYLNYVFENVEPSKRPEYIKGVVWSDKWFDITNEECPCSIFRFSEKGMLTDVYMELLKATDNKKVFEKIFDNLGVIGEPVDSSFLAKDYVPLNSELDDSGLWIKESLSM